MWNSADQHVASTYCCVTGQRKWAASVSTKLHSVRRCRTDPRPHSYPCSAGGMLLQALQLLYPNQVAAYIFILSTWQLQAKRWHTFKDPELCKLLSLTCGFLKSAYFSIRSINISLFWLSLVQLRRFSTRFSWSSKILSGSKWDINILSVFIKTACRTQNPVGQFPSPPQNPDTRALGPQRRLGNMSQWCETILARPHRVTGRNEG